MSLQAAKLYLSLLLAPTTPKSQARALLYTAGPVDLPALSEIFHNLLAGVFPLTPRIKRIVERRRKLLKKLAAKTASYKKKSSLLRKEFKSIYEILTRIRDLILELIE